MINRLLAVLAVAAAVGFAQPASAQLLQSLFGGDKAKAGQTRAEQAKPTRQADRGKTRQTRVKQEEAPAQVAITANEGELRSNVEPRRGFFGNILGNQPDAGMLPQTRALDGVMQQRASRKKFVVKPEMEPVVVAFSGYKPGTIVVDTAARTLYFVEGFNTARRYRIAVGKDGLTFKGKGVVGDKQEWPRWFPTKDMQKREPQKYGRYADGMNGGPDNPLGARAIYMHQGKKDTYIRIHGTNQPESIGSASSNGCFRMINDHVIDLYRRVKVGAEIVVL